MITQCAGPVWFEDCSLRGHAAPIGHGSRGRRLGRRSRRLVGRRELHAMQLLRRQRRARLRPMARRAGAGGSGLDILAGSSVALYDCTLKGGIGGYAVWNQVGAGGGSGLHLKDGFLLASGDVDRRGRGRERWAHIADLVVVRRRRPRRRRSIVGIALEHRQDSRLRLHGRRRRPRRHGGTGLHRGGERPPGRQPRRILHRSRRRGALLQCHISRPRAPRLHIHVRRGPRRVGVRVVLARAELDLLRAVQRNAPPEPALRRRLHGRDPLAGGELTVTVTVPALPPTIQGAPTSYNRSSSIPRRALS